MEAPNIQLYNLIRHDLRLSNGKSLELMDVLDKEYKSSVKEDLAALSKQMRDGFQQIEDRFQKVDARFQTIDDRFTTQDQHLVALDNKIDFQINDLRGGLRAEIKDASKETNRWLLGIFLAVLLSLLGIFLKR